MLWYPELLAPFVAGLSHTDSFEEDPHPNPPHKGEGTLPRALPTFLIRMETSAIC